MDLNDIYTKVILTHSRNKENKRNLENPTIVEPGHNPSCGDEIELYIKLNNNIIEDISFLGHGCAISQASTSIMCDEIRGKNLHEAHKMAKIFINMVTRKETTDEELEQLGDAIALKNISNMPQRLKCAVLCWSTLNDIIKEVNNEK